MARHFGGRYLFGGRRRNGPFSLVALLIGLFFVSGNSWWQGRKFVKACSELSPGQSLTDAEAILQLRKGKRVVLMPPQAERSVFEFRTFGAGTRTCELQHAEGLLVKATSP
jgi:hypothetical protein